MSKREQAKTQAWKRPRNGSYWRNFGWKTFISCHSYTKRDQYVDENWRPIWISVTPTHILEGYKVADKMKTHGAAVQPFGLVGI